MIKFESILVLMLALLLTFSVFSQNEEKKDEGYKFTEVKTIKTTPVKDQYRSGTCWSFSTLAFIEAELLRTGKGEYDLSEMFIVRKTYEDKAVKYVRYHGSLNFAGGGAFHDVFNVIKNYGILPESDYKGLEYGEKSHVHGELDEVLKAFVDAVKKNSNKKLSPVWVNAFSGILDAYLGKVPENFTYKGVVYNPQSFAKSLGLNMEDYVSISSFTHHPFYEKFIIEIPDNWAMEEVYNVKMDEMIEIIDNAINNGYTVAWGADVSEKGFSWTNGVAVVPEEDRPDLSGLERDKWEKLSASEKAKQLYSFDKPVVEKTITQELRQEEFDNYLTTDDHGMLICGIAKDQNGTKYYLVKNSWNTNNLYDGFFYVSEAFVKFKTTDFSVHKDALPKNIKKELNIK